jgi:hypothetical protein
MSKVKEEAVRFIDQMYIYEGKIGRLTSIEETAITQSKRVLILADALEDALKDLELLGNANLTEFRIKEALKRAEEVE